MYGADDVGDIGCRRHTTLSLQSALTAASTTELRHSSDWRPDAASALASALSPSITKLVETSLRKGVFINNILVMDNGFCAGKNEVIVFLWKGCAVQLKNLSR